MAIPGIGEQVAENISRHRKSLGMTQAHLAERISVEKETVSRMESGKITPSLSRLSGIAAALGCSVADLVRDASPDAQAQAECIADLIRPLSLDEQEAVVRFVRETVRLLMERKP